MAPLSLPGRVDIIIHGGAISLSSTPKGGADKAYLKYIHKRWLKNGFNTNVGPAARGKWLLCLCQVAAEGSFRLSLMEHSHNEE